MNVLTNAKSWLREATELGLLLVAFGVVIQLLFGTTNTTFIGNVTENFTSLISSLGSQGLVGLIALGVILHSFSKSRFNG